MRNPRASVEPETLVVLLSTEDQRLTRIDRYCGTPGGVLSDLGVPTRLEMSATRQSVREVGNLKPDLLGRPFCSGLLHVSTP